MIEETAKSYGLLLVSTSYIIALVVGIFATSKFQNIGMEPILLAFITTSFGTMVIYAFSLIYHNVSFYDPYWSVQPVVIAIYWVVVGFTNGNLMRQILVLISVSFWGIRLTMNWVRGWQGLNHEDWRYVKYRHDNPRLFPLIAFFGLEYMPTLLVFLGCLSMYPALTIERSLTILDGLAFLLTIMATLLELAADNQMYKFRHSIIGKVMNQELWSISRHPNYLGEILFWFGLFFFGFAASPKWYWTIAGPIAIALLFIFVSIPLMERRQLEKKPTYRKYQENVPILIPRKIFKRRQQNN